jgi:hypothetical protein
MTAIPDAVSLANWRRSRYCENGDGGCVEVSDGHAVGVPVRDSKNPAGPAIVFPNATWSAFVSAVRNSELP